MKYERFFDSKTLLSSTLVRLKTADYSAVFICVLCLNSNRSRTSYESTASRYVPLSRTVARNTRRKWEKFASRYYPFCRKPSSRQSYRCRSHSNPYRSYCRYCRYCNRNHSDSNNRFGGWLSASSRYNRGKHFAKITHNRYGNRSHSRSCYHSKRCYDY